MVKGTFATGKKDIVALGPTSADHLIHQTKQGYVNRRNAT